MKKPAECVNIYGLDETSFAEGVAREALTVHGTAGEEYWTNALIDQHADSKGSKLINKEQDIDWHTKAKVPGAEPVRGGGHGKADSKNSYDD